MEILMILSRFGQRKSNPIHFSPQTCAGDWKNKANFERAKMNVSIYINRDYEDFEWFRTVKKQSQSKPILLFMVYGSEFIAIVIPVETGIQSLGSYGFRIKCGMTRLIACLIEDTFEKTKPISPEYVWRKRFDGLYWPFWSQNP